MIVIIYTLSDDEADDVGHFQTDSIKLDNTNEELYKYDGVSNDS